jgi:hypothetical protein
MPALDEVVRTDTRRDWASLKGRTFTIGGRRYVIEGVATRREPDGHGGWGAEELYDVDARDMDSGALECIGVNALRKAVFDD